MGKGFGIAAMVLAILSTFAVYGFNFGAIWLSMIASAIAIFNGDRAFSIASFIIAATGLLLFSPVTMAVVTLNASGRGDYSLVWVAFLPFALPLLAACFLFRQHNIALRDKAEKGAGTTD